LESQDLAGSAAEITTDILEDFVDEIEPLRIGSLHQTHSPFEGSVEEIADLWHQPMAQEYARAYLAGRLIFYINKERLDALYLRDGEWFISVRTTSTLIRRLSILWRSDAR